MKQYFSILFVIILFLASCSKEDYSSLIEKKEYERAFNLSAERFGTTGDSVYLRDALFTANEYLEDGKICLPLLEKYFNEKKSYFPLEKLASLTFYNAALSFYRSDKYDSAIFYASKAFSIMNNYAKAMMLIGKSKVRSGDMKAGYADIQSALALDSTLSDGYTFLGNIHLINEELEKAEYFYRKAVSADTLYYDGWMNLGELLGIKKKVLDSEICYKKALSSDSTRIDAYDRLINIYTAKNNMDSVMKYMDIYQRVTGVKLQFR